MDPTLTLVPVAKIRDVYPSWPYEYEHTLKLAREGQLPCVKIKNRYFVNARLVQRFFEAYMPAL